MAGGNDAAYRAVVRGGRGEAAPADQLVAAGGDAAVHGRQRWVGAVHVLRRTCATWQKAQGWLWKFGTGDFLTKNGKYRVESEDSGG